MIYSAGQRHKRTGGGLVAKIVQANTTSFGMKETKEKRFGEAGNGTSPTREEREIGGFKEHSASLASTLKKCSPLKRENAPYVKLIILASRIEKPFSWITVIKQGKCAGCSAINAIAALGLSGTARTFCSTRQTTWPAIC